ncbi:MAG: hypothetical protein QW569_06550 [Candidatus Bathyarchaeia archaeon]
MSFVGRDMKLKSFDGIITLLTSSTWEHIIFKHPELKGKRKLIIEALKNPDEVFLDLKGSLYILKRVDLVSDYLVIVCGEDVGGRFIKTAYFSSLRRKERYYKWFRRLKP